MSKATDAMKEAVSSATKAAKADVEAVKDIKKAQKAVAQMKPAPKTPPSKSSKVGSSIPLRTKKKLSVAQSAEKAMDKETHREKTSVAEVKLKVEVTAVPPWEAIPTKVTVSSPSLPSSKVVESAPTPSPSFQGTGLRASPQAKPFVTIPKKAEEKKEKKKSNYSMFGKPGTGFVSN